jgi:putative acyl-CoA dehydrogenase
VICLDVLRAMAREPGAVEVFFGELALAQGADRRFDAARAELERELREREGLEARARRITERMAICLQASLLLRHAPAAVADAFCATRIDSAGGRAYGTLPPSTDVDAILRRAWPE